MIKKLETCSLATEIVTKKIHEIIDEVNKQREEIEQLKKDNSKLDNRTAMFQKVGGFTADSDSIK